MNRKQLSDFDLYVNEARNQAAAGNLAAAKIAFARATAAFNEAAVETKLESKPEPTVTTGPIIKQAEIPSREGIKPTGTAKN